MARILVIDDNADAMEALCTYLAKLGYAIECVLNGKDAMEHVLRRMPDLVILDLLMPQLDGCRLLEIMRSYLRLNRLPVVVLTALTDSPMIERVRDLKVNAVLVKGKATLDDIAEAVDVELHRAAK
jgi:CheY-like chemotaxis protein